MKENFIAAICIGVCAITSFPNAANAQATYKNASTHYNDERLFIPSVYAHDNAWNAQNYDFTTPVTPPIISEAPQGTSTTDETAATTEGQEKASFKSDDEDWEEKILKKLPFKNTLKYTWDFIDGEEDIYFEGLRMDRGNRGIEYKTQNIPFIGTVDAIRIKAEMGQSSKVTFQSDYIPLIGRVDGFNIKASAGSRNKISFRYKTDIDW